VDYIRRLNRAEFGENFSALTLASRETGSEHCLFRVARVRAHGKAVEESHIHPVDKFYYILEGVMTVEVAGEMHQAEPHTLVFIPANVPHRNWNEGDVDEVHIIFFVPEPEPGQPFLTPVP
jgi:mannose-6-phosphate isomerase-like protein (cupin superfamily)